MVFVHKPPFGGKLNPDRCAAHVSGSTFSGHQCSRKGILEHDGHKWCKQHYPPNVDARDKARHEKWRAERAVEQEKWRKAGVAKYFQSVLLLIANGHSNPRQIAQDILDEYDGKGE